MEMERGTMKTIFVLLGTILAACSALVFWSGRAANRREAKRISAKNAAALLAQAWADNHTRA